MRCKRGREGGACCGSRARQEAAARTRKYSCEARLRASVFYCRCAHTDTHRMHTQWLTCMPPERPIGYTHTHAHTHTARARTYTNAGNACAALTHTHTCARARIVYTQTSFSRLCNLLHPILQRSRPCYCKVTPSHTHTTHTHTHTHTHARAHTPHTRTVYIQTQSYSRLSDQLYSLPFIDPGRATVK